MQRLKTKKALLIIGLIILVGITIPLTLFLQSNQTEDRSHASAATTLYYSPTTTATTPLKKIINDTFSVDVQVDPGTNVVSVIRYDIQYDPTKLQLDPTNPFVINTASFPATLEGPIITSGHITGTVSTGSSAPPISVPAKVATLTFKAISTTSTPTQVIYGTQSQVLSVASTDQASENILSATVPINISVLTTPTPTPTPISCNLNGGSGGSAIGATGITVHGGNGGAGGVINGICTPGTNGENVDASKYCSANSIALTWPATSTASYYRLLIDNIEVYKGTGLAYSAANYAVGPQHTITLYAGNTLAGDFNPSLGGYFQIQSTACAAPTATPTPIPTATPTPLPTSTPVPTPTSLKVSISLLLHGIGASGDNVNPSPLVCQGTQRDPAKCLSNQNPLHKTRPLTIEFSDSTGAIIATKTSSAAYNNANGDFEGTVDMGRSLPADSYIIKVRTDYFLKKAILGIQKLTAGQTALQLPLTTLVTGDTNNDNKLDISDYNVIIDCYSDFAPAVACDATKKLQADLTDDGKVNQADYNLFLRDLSVQNGD